MNNTETTTIDQIETSHLSREESDRLLKTAERLVKRLTAESWAREMGWEIPPYGSSQWNELFEAWLNSSDD
jgi:hypothetical protein